MVLVRLGFKLTSFHMPIDFLVSKLEGYAFHRRRTADEAFQRHAQDTGVEINAGIGVVGGQHQMVQMVNHGVKYPFL